VVERTNQRHHDGKYGQPNIALFQECHNHAEFGAGMTAERFLFFPINAAISNPVIPTKVGIQNL
ncbi:hypothetical protein, partial [Neisseria meningitidis]|uniref:hypothetical protein n=1 Tax=Neisseria meningitidis TaxID=487 RepID=UPI001E3499FE